MGKRGRPKKSQPPAKKTKRQEGERRPAASAGLSGQGIPESENASSPPVSLPGLHVATQSDSAHRLLGPAGEADLSTAGTIQPVTMVAPTGQPPSRSRRRANSPHVTVTGAEGPAACGNDWSSTSSGPLPTSLPGCLPNSALCGGQTVFSDAASSLSSAPASRNQQRGDIAFTNLPAPTSQASPPGPQRAPAATANDPGEQLPFLQSNQAGPRGRGPYATLGEGVRPPNVANISARSPQLFPHPSELLTSLSANTVISSTEQSQLNSSANVRPVTHTGIMSDATGGLNGSLLGASHGFAEQAYNYTASPLSPQGGLLGVGVPLTVREKIWKGEYVELSLLLNKRSGGLSGQSFGATSRDTNSVDWSLVQSGQSIVLRQAEPKQKIWSIELWTEAFLTFCSIYLQAKPECARPLLKYCSVIRAAAHRYVGLGWRDYDAEFRARMAATKASNWEAIDGELWLLHVVGGGQLKSSSSMGGMKAAFQGPRQHQFKSNQNSSGGYKPPRQPGHCFEFNYKGACTRAFCRFNHCCSMCGSVGHGKTTCPHPRSKQNKPAGQAPPQKNPSKK